MDGNMGHVTLLVKGNTGLVTLLMEGNMGHITQYRIISNISMPPFFNLHVAHVTIEDVPLLETA